MEEYDVVQQARTRLIYHFVTSDLEAWIRIEIGSLMKCKQSLNGQVFDSI